MTALTQLAVVTVALGGIARMRVAIVDVDAVGYQDPVSDGDAAGRPHARPRTDEAPFTDRDAPTVREHVQLSSDDRLSSSRYSLRLACQFHDQARIHHGGRGRSLRLSPQGELANLPPQTRACTPAEPEEVRKQLHDATTGKEARSSDNTGMK